MIGLEGVLASQFKKLSFDELCERLLTYLDEHEPKMLFIQFDSVDGAGHRAGYGSQVHLDRITHVDGMLGKLIAKYEEKGIFEDTLFIVTADHGGHDRTHGTELPEDTTIPMFYFGKQFETGKRFSGGSILDIAPTIAKIMDVAPADEWEGTPVIQG
jgi:predicted AlkP superfamily pyrophosphatase or phosphodiesterase